MEDNRKLNPLLIVLAFTTLLLGTLCVILFLGKNKAENSLDEIKAQYDSLLADNTNLQQTYNVLFDEHQQTVNAYSKLVQEKKEAELAAEEEKKRTLEYETDLRDVVYLMLDGAALSEQCANITQSVWNNCIYEKKNEETDKYTLNDKGKFFDDFNDALSNLFNDYEYADKYWKIKDNQSEVTKRIRNLKNPPNEWKDAYSELMLYYDSYYDFTELILNTRCSLKEFSEYFKTYDTETVKHYNKMKLYLE